MSFTVLSALGALAGFGAIGVYVGVCRNKPRLAEIVARYESATSHASHSELPRRSGLFGGVGAALNSMAARLGLPLASAEDLAMTGGDQQRQIARLGLSSLVGATGGLLLAALSSAALPIPRPLLFLALPLAGVIAGISIPARLLAAAARKERESFLRAFGCWLELVALAQAGGMGIEGALRASYSVCDNQCFRLIQVAIEESTLGTLTPWEALAQLGRRIGVNALVELSATLSLAGTEGARVKSSLLAKAQSLRQRAIAQAEAEANATTERLFLPSILLMLSFMIFIVYPAGARLAGLV